MNKNELLNYIDGLSGKEDYQANKDYYLRLAKVEFEVEPYKYIVGTDPDWEYENERDNNLAFE